MRAREVLSQEVTLTLTEREKELLLRLSDRHGASMRGFLRKLIHDAANSELGRGELREEVALELATKG